MEKNENFKDELTTQYSILIKAKEKREKNHFIILISILSLTLISAILCVFFTISSFNNTNKLLKDKNKDETVFLTLSTTFNGNNELNLEGIGNDYELSTPKKINITNEGNEKITFNIKLTSINTSLLSTNKLYYIISHDNEESSPKVLPLNPQNIINKITLEPEESTSFIINAYFDGTFDKNDYSNYYNAQIVIEQDNEKLNLID